MSAVRWTVLLSTIVAAVALPAMALAHVERPAYWPDPAPDCSISPCAGGAVPTIRSLASALDRRLPGDTRVVCQKDSLSLLARAVARARKHGFDIRPTDHRRLSAKQARVLLRTNRSLFARCRYHEIQPAVMASHNNDRVVVLPGLYTEPTARAQPTHDPACIKYQTHTEYGDPGAVSYAYQVHCPNDANLVAVIGRAVGPGADPDPPLVDRHGIPNLGPCIRCNLQLEGSGVSADDVVIEAGDAKAGNGGPSAAGHRKDVGIFADRADGFVLRNVTVRHATEHDIYILESDGYVFDRFKTFYAGAYGVLTFVEDHGLMENCEAKGNGDSGLYPGAGADTGAQRRAGTEFRYSQEIRLCDSHHNASGYSGTDGNATHIDHNNFYDNALGFTTDVFTAPGHPGFPQDSDLIEDNNFYSNNFNPFVSGSEVRPFVGVAVGTGLWIAGGNDNVVRNNHFWDNRRRGVMLFSAPDATVCGPVIGKPVTGCDTSKISTSHGNRFYGNVMGVAGDGEAMPNGTDFWWDSFPGNTGNCWYGNVAAAGGSISSSPASLPACAGGSNPGSSIGTGDVANESELVSCLAGFQVFGYPNGNPALCSWTVTPPKPGSARAAAARRTARSADTRRRQAFLRFCATIGPGTTCAPVSPVVHDSATALESFAGTAWLTPVSPRAQTLTPPAAAAHRALGLYTCADWQRAGAAVRSSVLRRLRAFAGGPVEGNALIGFGTLLADRQATALFAARCGHAYARSFALYKIYGFAAGFAGVAP